MSNAGKIFSLIPKIMADLGAIKKDRTNTHQSYAFRGIEDMYNSIHPILVKHAVFCVPQVLEEHIEHFQKADGKMSFRIVLRVNHRFYAEDGSYVDATTTGEGIDTSDKSANKAMSAAMKYAFIELFSIPTQDIDDSDRTTDEIEGTKFANVAKTMAPQKGGKPNGSAAKEL